MTAIHKLACSESSSFWGSLQGITSGDGFTSEQTSHEKCLMMFDSISRVIDIIDCAEELTIFSNEFFGEDLEPTPIGPNGIANIATDSDSLQEQEDSITMISVQKLKNQPMLESTDHFLEMLLYSHKRSAETYDSENCHSSTKKQKLSITPHEIVRSSSAEFLSASPLDNIKEDHDKEQMEPARFRRYQANQWMERFDDLVQFKAERGHCLVPHSFPPNQQLAQWVKRQRYQYKLKMLGRHSTLTDERQYELEKMGFIWDSHEAAWDERLEDLKNYRSRFGNCLVPTTYDVDRSLGVWVKCQRRQLRLFHLGKPTTMTHERFEKLDRLGFDWNPRKL